MKEYRLVNELYLDWISTCINRGKIYNMVGGSVTHTNYPLDKEIKEKKRCFRPGARQKLELESTVLG